MPFTPFHFGLGAALKAVAPRRFSFTLFCYSQVVTDLESGYNMLTGRYPAHGIMHSFAGATAVAIVCAVTGRPLCQWALRTAEKMLAEPKTQPSPKHAVISWSTVFMTAFAGTYSHVLLDGMMHRDMRPFAPFTDANPLLHLVSGATIELGCVLLAIIGFTAWVLRKKSARAPD